MRVCVVGAGAIGGLLAARLAGTEAALTLVDRGAQAVALRTCGLTLVREDGTETIERRFRVVEEIEEAGPQDIVVLSVKAYDIPAVAPHLPAVFHDGTTVITVQNGIPWWYFQLHGGTFDGYRLSSLDPDGAIEENIDPGRIVACVCYPAAEVVEPGVVRHVEGWRIPVGELDGSSSERAHQLSDLLARAGFKSRVLDDVRSEIWLKAWGSLSFNPVSALTGATLEEICSFPETRRLVAAMMEEAQRIAEKLGVTFRHPIERRISGAEAVGAHKTSMLQDVEAGRPLEVEALVGSVVELGRLTETMTPTIGAVYGCAKLLNERIIGGR